MSITTTLFTFSLAALLLTMTPGMDTALVLRTSVAEGRKSALQAALGISAGCYLWGAFIALGLGAVLTASHFAYDILKWVGATYLSWLAIQLLISRPQPLIISADNQIPANNWFLRGCLGNVLNPKIGVFYLSFLPQFIPAGQSPLVWTFLLVSIHVVLGTLWSVVLISLTGKAAVFLQRPKIVTWMNRATAGVFIAFATKMVLSSR